MSISDLISWLVITFQKIINGLFFGFFSSVIGFEKCKNLQLYISLNIVLWQRKLWAMKAENCEKLPIIRWKSYFKNHYCPIFSLIFHPNWFLKKRRKINNFIFHKTVYCEKANYGKRKWKTVKITNIIRRFWRFIGPFLTYWPLWSIPNNNVWMWIYAKINLEVIINICYV